jgi:hypothetical protein
MTTSVPRPARTAIAADTSEAVDQFMTRLEHPHKAAIELLRQIICGADPSIAEGVKWNAPSFRTTEYFATTHLREKDGIGIILHVGAKVRERPSFQIDDPQGLIKWLARDRALVNFAGVEDVRAHEAAIQAVVRQWITSV